MSLATSCPTCGTVFRVVQDQLKVSEGWVRCGHCQEVFNALEGLFDLTRRDSTTQEHAPDLAIPATSDPKDPAWMETRPAMFSDGRVLRERQEALQNRSATAPGPTPAPATAGRATPPAVPAKRVEISTRRAATWDPSVQEPERGMAPTQPDPGAWRTTSADTSLPPVTTTDIDARGTPFEPREEPVADSLLAAPDLDETAYPATTLEFRSEAFSAFAAARLRKEGRPDVDLPLETPPSPATPAPAATPSATPAADTRSDPRPTAPAPTADEPAVTEPSRPEPDLEKTLDLSAELHMNADRAEAATPVGTVTGAAKVEPAPTAEAVVTALTPAPRQDAATEPTADDGARDSMLLPEFVRHANRQARWERPAVRAMLGLVAFLLGSLLLAQTTWHWRDLIAARWPVTQPLLAQACVRMSCQLQAPALLDALVVDSTTLTRPPGTEHFVLGVTLHNRVNHAIAAPHIELSLTDMAGAVVLRRVLSPAEFRQPAALAAQSDASWSVAFASTNPRIAGYTLAAFYP